MSAAPNPHPPWYGEQTFPGHVPQAEGMLLSPREDTLPSTGGETQGVLFLGWVQRTGLVQRLWPLAHL